MKSITGNPALDAYQRMAVSRVSGATPAARVEPGKAEQGPPPEAARVSISSEARDLAAGSHVDTHKVEDLRAKVQDGSFQVDAALVARRMLDTSG